MFVSQYDYSLDLKLFQGSNRFDCMPFMFAVFAKLLLSPMNARASDSVETLQSPRLSPST
jgi:hypothetical protein